MSENEDENQETKMVKNDQEVSVVPFEVFHFLFTLFLTSFFNQTTSVTAYDSKTHPCGFLKILNFFIKSYAGGEEETLLFFENSGKVPGDPLISLPTLYHDTDACASHYYTQ